MRATASILHLDLDAFFASVEQRDKPSLRGKPVIVGGLGPRGVVSTASYEARVFGARSAMAMSEARRRAPHAAFLAGRFDAYRAASRVVMGLLRELSPSVEPLSLDEAYVDLLAGDHPTDPDSLVALGERLRADVVERTGGLTASVGIGSSKFIAKLASEMAKPDGLRLVLPGTEVETIAPLPARAIPGVGPATMDKLSRLGVQTVRDLQQLSARELMREIGKSGGQALHELAFARDDRTVEASREAKSISVEQTFDIDVRDRAELEAIIDRDAGKVAERMRRNRLFARTISIKVRMGDFTTLTRSRTLVGASDEPAVIADAARALLSVVDLRGGVRLLGVGVSGFTEAAQPELFAWHDDADTATEVDHSAGPDAGGAVGDDGATEASDGRALGDAGVTASHDRCALGDAASPEPEHPTWRPGADVTHDDFGPGWVWGAGLGRVTVRFETAETGPGPVRTFADDDPHLHPAGFA